LALKDNYFTITEAAKQLNVTRQTVSRWIASGVISGEKIGRETLIDRHELEQFDMGRKIAEEIVIHMVGLIREKYGYDKDDLIEFVHFDRRRTHSFVVTRKNGDRESIKIYIGKVERLVRKKGDPFLLVGAKVPIDKIVKKPYKKEE
jgi:excisionase family DNA binding protein